MVSNTNQLIFDHSPSNRRYDFIVLLRTFNRRYGLTKGDSFIVIQCSKRVIQAKIRNGEDLGYFVLIPNKAKFFVYIPLIPFIPIMPSPMGLLPKRKKFYLQSIIGCRIDVNVCASVRALKYIHKYIYRSNDKDKGCFRNVLPSP
ncbi:hypothetical protein AQUCO_127700001v1 [Aquilegia coerulea]|uniref:Uncharacterized protein n=1 Tax=Aquilegia coerulea TaxID=218851 RepID=A0A2G5C076_AQUCA|nr:hypothetical protein AQUCO_127700001v1 [Aquilegia coerulea]